jgi:hypothetical protein
MGGNKPMRIKRTSLEVPEALWLRWKIRAAKEGVSMKDLVLRALTRYLGRQQ